jgi:hypothetical protein
LPNKVSGLSNEKKCTQDFDNSEEKESSWEPDPILQSRTASGNVEQENQNNLKWIYTHLYGI